MYGIHSHYCGGTRWTARELNVVRVRVPVFGSPNLAPDVVILSFDFQNKTEFSIQIIYFKNIPISSVDSEHGWYTLAFRIKPCQIPSQKRTTLRTEITAYAT